MNKFLVIFVLLTVVSGCRTKKAIVNAPPAVLPVKEVLRGVEENQPKFEWLSGKASANIITPSNSVSVSANFRMKRGGAIWLTASPALGIEAARALITPDSVKVLDRINNEYMLNAFEYLYKYFPRDIKFNDLQDLLIANLVNMRPEIKYTESSVDNNNHYLEAGSQGIVKKLWIDPIHKTIQKFIIEDKDHDQKVTATYSNYTREGNVNFPMAVNIIAEGKQKATIELKWSRVNFDSPQEFPFNVPEKYEPMR